MEREDSFLSLETLVLQGEEAVHQGKYFSVVWGALRWRAAWVLWGLPERIKEIY